MNITLPFQTISVLSNKYIQADFFQNSNTLLITAIEEFIPEEEFKEIFNQINLFIATISVEKLIFDKRQLTQFHHPSMEWYHIEWKPKAAFLGLKKHVKLLPHNMLFRMSVELGRKKIFSKIPEGFLKDIKIFYCESLEDAFAI